MDVVAELKRRVLSDLATCQAVWEHEHDPIALAAAVILSALPPWLEESMLCVVLKPEMRDRARQTRSARIAFDFAVAIHAGGKWTVPADGPVLSVPEAVAAKYDISEDAALQTYTRVKHDLEKHPYRYYHVPDPIAEKILAAIERIERLVTVH